MSRIPFWAPANVGADGEDFTGRFANDTTLLWETVTIAGAILTGQCELTVTSSRKTDVKAGPGHDGATLTHQGYEPAKVEVKVRVWTRAQLKTWEALVAEIQPRPNKGENVKAYSVAHPNLALLGIRALFVEEITGLHKSSVAGVLEARIKFLQWIQTSKIATTSTAKGAYDLNNLDKQSKPRSPLASYDTTPTKPSSTPPKP